MAKEILTGIKNIIFDMGGVIININYHLTAHAFEKLGVKGFDKIFAQVQQIGFIDDFEMGKVSPAEFRNLIREVTNQIFSDAQIDEAWNSLILDMPLNRIRILEKVKNDFNIFLLSNNNAIHYGFLSKKFESLYPILQLESLFQKTYYSHLIGMRKPNANAFNLVIQENNLTVSETLFIDDSPQHIEGGAKCRLNTFFVDEKNSWETLFG